MDKSVDIELGNLIKLLEAGGVIVRIKYEHKDEYPAVRSQIREWIGYLAEGDQDVAAGLVEFLYHESMAVRQVALTGLLQNFQNLPPRIKDRLRQIN
jgi:hypothetical protein